MVDLRAFTAIVLFLSSKKLSPSKFSPRPGWLAKKLINSVSGCYSNGFNGGQVSLRLRWSRHRRTSEVERPREARDMSRGGEGTDKVRPNKVGNEDT